MITNLPYGLKNGELISIREVESGLSCNCVCPACGAKLVARKGKVKAHHFAHNKTEGCEYGVESALHLAAKNLLEKKKEIVLPSLYVREEDSSWNMVKVSEKTRVVIDEVRLEKRVSDFVPDIIARIGSKELLIEIAVTHFVDEEKEIKVRNNGVSMIEIDLSMLDDGFTDEDLEDLVVESEYTKQWIYNAMEQTLFSKYLYLRSKSIEEAKRKIEQEKAVTEAKLKEVNFQHRLNKNRQEGFSIISYENDQVYCPKKIHEQANYYKPSAFTTRLAKGEKWNGKLYGQVGNERYLFVGSERIQIFPKTSEDNSTDQENKQRRSIYGQIRAIQEKSVVTIEEDCMNCEFLREIIRDFPKTASCGYYSSLDE